MQSVRPIRGVPFNLSKFRFFDHFVLKFFQKESSPEEINQALLVIKKLFLLKETPSQKIPSINSLCRIITYLNSNSRLKPKLIKFLSKIEEYNNKWRPYHNLIFQSLFDENICNYLINDSKIFIKILGEGNKQKIERDIESYKINIYELFQQFRDFLQWIFLYVHKFDEVSAIAFIKFKFEMKREGKPLREIQFTISKLWDILEKLDFLLQGLFQFEIIDIPEDDIYRQIRNASSHSNFIHGNNKEERSILEENVGIVIRATNKRLPSKLSEVKLLNINQDDLEQELICWVGFLSQIFSTYAFWNRL